MASLQKNVAGQNFTFAMVSTTTGLGLAGLTITGFVTKDGGAQAGTAGTFTSLGNGQYNYAPTQAETNATDVGFLMTNASAITTNIDFHTDLTDAGGNVQVDVTKWLGTAVTAATAGIPDVNVKNINNAAVSTTTAQVGTNVVQINAVATTPVTTINANQGTTQPINFTGTGGSALVQSDTRDWLGTVVATPATAGIPDINIKNIANAAVNTASAQIGANVAAINANTTAPAALMNSTLSICWGTASSGTTTTVTASAINNPASLTDSGQLIGRTIIFLGTTANTHVQAQASNITASTTGATPTITFTAMTAAPASGDLFVIV